MSEKNIETKNNVSLYVIILLCLFLIVSLDFNIRYLLAGTSLKSLPAAPVTQVVPANKDTQSMLFNPICKHYGFLHESEYLPLTGIKSDSRSLLAVDGSVEKIEANLWVIIPEPRSSLMLYTDSKTKISGNFNAGDCVRAIYAGDNSNKAILIQPQP